MNNEGMSTVVAKHKGLGTGSRFRESVFAQLFPPYEYTITDKAVATNARVCITEIALERNKM